MTPYTPATQHAYAAAWEAWEDWLGVTLGQGDPARRDEHALLERYLIEQWSDGASPPTLDAIYTRLQAGYAAADRDWPDPERTLPERWRLARERRALGRKQAQALTAARLAVLDASGSVPQRVIALIRTLRDGLLDVADVRTRRWADITTHDTGSAHLRVMRPERDIWLSPATAQALAAIRPDGATDDDPVFATRRAGLLWSPRAETLTAWIRKAARDAGLGDRYSSRSPRYGMLADLPEHVGRDPLPVELGWAQHYENHEVVRWYMVTPPQPGGVIEPDPLVAAAPVHSDLEAVQLREWLQAQGPSATWMWQRLGLRTETVWAWQSGRTRPPSWMALVVAADRRAGGAPAEGAPDLLQAKRAGGWSDAALAAGLGIARATVRRWLDDGAPDLVLRYAIRELELRVPPAGRSGRGAAAKLSDPSYRAINWPPGGSAPRDTADPGDEAGAAEAGTRVPHVAEPAGEGTARAAAAMPRDTADPDAAADAAAALVRVASTQLQRARQDDDPQSADDGYREAAAAGLEAGNPRGREIAADALARRADALAARLASPEDDVDAYREVVAVYREAARAGRAAATSMGRGIAARATYLSGWYLERSRGDEAEIESAYRDAALLGHAAANSEGLRTVAYARYALGRAYTRWGRPEADIEAAYRDAVEAGRAAGDSQALEVVAFASRALATQLARWDRPQAEVETAYREAAEAGREAGTAGGQLTAARARLSLAAHLEQWDRPQANVEDAYREAAVAGREAGGREGLAVTAAASLALAALLVRWGRSADEVEDTYREAAEAGRDAGTAGGWSTVASARRALAALLTQWGRPQAEVEAAYRAAGEAGRKAGVPEALEVAAGAMCTLGGLLADWGRAPDEVVSAYRAAAALGEESMTPGGLGHTAAARYMLAELILDRVLTDVDYDAEYREATTAGRRSGTPRGLLFSARSFEALAISYPGGEAEVANWRDAVADGRAADGPEGLEISARASASLARLLQQQGSEPAEIEAAWRDAVADGRAAATPEGLGTAASASVTLAGLLPDWGRDRAEIEAAWRDAVADGRAAATPEGLGTAAQALLGLADELRKAGRHPAAIAAAYRDAVGAAREVGTPEALLAAGRSLCLVGDAESYREAAALGREAAALGHGQADLAALLSEAFGQRRENAGMLLAAEAELGLGRALLQRVSERRGIEKLEQQGEEDTAFREAVAALREAAAVGEAVGAPRGQELCGEAMLTVGDAYGGRKGRDAVTPRGLPAVIHDKKYREALERAATAESAYRTATDAGMAAGSSAGQLIVAQAQFALGDAYQTWQRPRVEIEELYRAAATAGREAGTPAGLEWTARALVRIAEASSEWSWSRERIAETCREAGAAGREADTPVGLQLGSIAMRLCGDALSRRRLLQSEPREEIRDAYQQAAEMGQQAQTPQASIEASRAFLALALAHERWGEPSEKLFEQAVAAGREAGSYGWPHVATALTSLAGARMAWRRPQEEVEATYREAVAEVETDRRDAGREAAVAAHQGILEAYRSWGRPKTDIDTAEREWRNARDR